MQIAILSTQQELKDDAIFLEPQMLLKAVERSQMVTSTVVQFFAF